MTNMYNNLDNYDERLLNFITEYTRQIGVPPSIDTILENVEGKKSKSTIYNRLQKMVRNGLLTQKNMKGYYYPTSLECKEILIPQTLLIEACRILTSIPEGITISQTLYSYVEKKEG